MKKVHAPVARIRKLIDMAGQGTVGHRKERGSKHCCGSGWRRAATAEDMVTETKMTKEAVVTTMATARQQINCSAGENVA